MITITLTLIRALGPRLRSASIERWSTTTMAEDITVRMIKGSTSPQTERFSVRRKSTVHVI